MNKKLKFWTMLSTIFIGSFSINYLVKNNSNQIKALDEYNAIDNNNLNTVQETFDATLIGADKGTFTLEYNNINSCKLKKVNEKFYVKGKFNFNGGSFTYRHLTYTITEIGDSAFEIGSWSWAHFSCASLTFPSTIKKIGNRAFYYNTGGRTTHLEMSSIHFEEGIEYIGNKAFCHCDDISHVTNIIIFPNSLKFIAHDAFSEVWKYTYYSPIFDFTKLDHVVKSDDDMTKNFDCRNYYVIVKNKDMYNQYAKTFCYSKMIEKIFIYGEKHCFICLPIWFLLNEKPDFSWYKFTSGCYFCMSYTNRDNCFFRKVDDNNSMIIKKSFSFNGGHLNYDGFEYTFTEICEEAFNVQTITFDWFFENCVLTIPSTIKKIGNYAFHNNSNSWSCTKEIIGINFEEGLEDIGEGAFKKCNDLKTDTIKLPNSLKHMGNDAFSRTKIKKVDLSALDHVIETDCKVDSSNGCLPSSVDVIYLKNFDMYYKYAADSNWKSVKNKFKIKCSN